MNEPTQIQKEILNILIDNGYQPGDVTTDTYIYENDQHVQIVIERPDENQWIEDANHFRPHAEYIIPQFFKNTQQCNKMLLLVNKKERIL